MEMKKPTANFISQKAHPAASSGPWQLS